MASSFDRIHRLACAVVSGTALAAALPALAAPITYETAVLADDPYVYYRLNDPAVAGGTAAADSSGDARTGTYLSNTGGTATGGVLGIGPGSDNAVSFPGTGTGATGAYLGAANATAATDIKAFGTLLGVSSVEMVFKVNPGFSSAAKQSLFGVFDPSASPTDVEVTLNSQGNDALATTANTTRFYVKGNDGDGQGVHFTNATLYDGDYHHLVFTFDQTLTGVGAFTAYVDGIAQTLTLQQVATGTGDTDNADPDTFTAFDFDPTFAGRNVRAALGGAAVGRLANVTIDEAALYATVLSPTAVAAHAAAVPEPGSLALLFAAGLGTLPRRRRA